VLPARGLLLVLTLAASAALAAGCASSGHGSRAAGSGNGRSATAVARTAAAVPASASRRWQTVYRTGGISDVLSAVTAVGPADAWAAGTDGNGPLLLRWDGARWQQQETGRQWRNFVPSYFRASGTGNIWLFGVRTGGPPEAFRFDGRAWLSQQLPAGPWQNAAGVVVLAADNAWMAQGGCKGRSWPWSCSSTIEHWTGSGWLASHLHVLISGLAAVAGHVWAAGVTGVRPVGSIHPTDYVGHLVIFRRDAGSWQPVSVPAVPVGGTSCEGNPQLVAGDNRAWVLCWSPLHKNAHGDLYQWQSGSWTRITIPARSGGGPMFTEPQLGFDGNAGVWVGPLAHWTGRQWVNADIGPRVQVSLYATAGIPDSGSSWSVACRSGVIGPLGPCVIAINGPRPS
jgi:hypothetical protein